jgi:hypothetical protein
MVGVLSILVRIRISFRFQRFGAILRDLHGWGFVVEVGNSWVGSFALNGSVGLCRLRSVWVAFGPGEVK